MEEAGGSGGARLSLGRIGLSEDLPDLHLYSNFRGQSGFLSEVPGLGFSLNVGTPQLLQAVFVVVFLGQ